ncbi:MAG: acylphosphatase [Deltaproteobacteria bacterium RIFOXYD12_FULL_57_12]|nr:MAG: acylphosphatase [Deltaproteobacteria bacterium RIFOXYD12_FULL_57_12]
MSQKRVHVVVEGRVQGVYFRAYTQEEAIRLGLSGWVRNRPDGSVEAVAEGDAEAVARLLDWFWQGSPLSLVSRVRVNEEAPIGETKGFEIHYG